MAAVNHDDVKFLQISLGARRPSLTVLRWEIITLYKILRRHLLQTKVFMITLEIFEKLVSRFLHRLLLLNNMSTICERSNDLDQNDSMLTDFCAVLNGHVLRAELRLFSLMMVLYWSHEDVEGACWRSPYRAAQLLKHLTHVFHTEPLNINDFEESFLKKEMMFICVLLLDNEACKHVENFQNNPHAFFLHNCIHAVQLYQAEEWVKANQIAASALKFYSGGNQVSEGIFYKLRGQLVNIRACSLLRSSLSIPMTVNSTSTTHNEAIEWLNIGARQFKSAVCLWNLATLATSSKEACAMLHRLLDIVHEEMEFIKMHEMNWVQCLQVTFGSEQRLCIMNSSCQDAHHCKNKILLRIARIYYHDCKYNEAADCYLTLFNSKAALPAEIVSEDLRLEAAWVLYHAGRLSEAISLVDGSLQACGACLRVYAELTSQSKRAKFDLLENLCNDAIVTSIVAPKRRRVDDVGNEEKERVYKAFLMCNMGVVRLIAKDYQGAAHFLGLARSQNPENLLINYNYTLCLYAAGTLNSEASKHWAHFRQLHASGASTTGPALSTALRRELAARLQRISRLTSAASATCTPPIEEAALRLDCSVLKSLLKDC